jgi:hypothetical protein
MGKPSPSRDDPVEDDKVEETLTEWVRVSKQRRPRRLRQAPKPSLTIEQNLA